MVLVYDFELLQLNLKMFVVHSGFSKSGKWFVIDYVEMFNTIVGIFLIVSLLLVGFSKERIEDEYVKSLRLSSLQWAVVVNYIILIAAFLFVYDLDFMYVMIFNVFTVLIIYVARFNILLYMNSKKLKNEE